MNKIEYCIKKFTSIKTCNENRKNKVLLVSLIVLLTITVGATIAFIYTKTQSVTNIFKPSNVTCEIVETFDYLTKTDVKIKNTGDTEAYIRARIVVNWIDDNNNISAIKPILGKDYSLEDDKNVNWIKIGDYYYHKKAISADGFTETLITSCKQLAPDSEYSLFVEILGESIQSTPLDAVKGSWNVKIAEDGTITGKEGQ